MFAAEAAGLRLEAEQTAEGIFLHGSKPWCSLAAQLDHAVLTAQVQGSGRGAFAVDLHAQGLREIPSGTVHFDGVPAVPLGGPGWYYQRPGFAWGGMGVAACWLGGAVAAARGYTESLKNAASGGREPDQIALAHLGEIDRTLTSLTRYLAQTAARIDSGELSTQAAARIDSGELSTQTAARIDSGELSTQGAWREALRVRGSVATAVERIQAVVSQDLGPGPLAFDERYGKRMADLSLRPPAPCHARRRPAGCPDADRRPPVVTFTHNDAGTSENAWAASGLAMLPELPLDAQELAGTAFIVLAAHPDDESLGAEVRVLLCTAGEASHPGSPTTTPEQLAAVRLQEFGGALANLLPDSEWQHLGLPDGKLAQRRQAIHAALQEAVTDCGRPAERIILVAPYRHDGHTDHDVLGSVAAGVSAAGHGLLEYPVWYWLWAEPADPAWQSWLRLPLSPAEQQAKQQAMASHASQVRALSELPGDEVLLPPSFLQHFERPWETFAWQRPAPQPSGTPGGSYAAGDAEVIFDAVHSGNEDPWQYTTSWYDTANALSPSPRCSAGATPPDWKSAAPSAP